MGMNRNDKMESTPLFSLLYRNIIGFQLSIHIYLLDIYRKILYLLILLFSFVVWISFRLFGHRGRSVKYLIDIVIFIVKHFCQVFVVINFLRIKIVIKTTSDQFENFKRVVGGSGVLLFENLRQKDRYLYLKHILGGLVELLVLTEDSVKKNY